MASRFRMPELETSRLRIRELTLADGERLNDVLNCSFGAAVTLAEREAWLQWTVLGYEMFAKLGQPHYGERAIVLQATNELIGAVGSVPYVEDFSHVAAFNGRSGVATAEVGLFWAIDPDFQQQGYATEAAGAVARFLLDEHKIGRIIATTGADNLASQAVMRKIGMVVEDTKAPSPHGGVVGVLARP